MQNPGTRTAHAALVLSILSLGAAVWTGCRDDQSAARSHTEIKPPARVSAVADPAAATPAAQGAPVAPASTLASRAATTRSGTHEIGPSKTPLPATAESTELSVRRIAVTTGIENREPVASDGFHADRGPIFAFVELSNGSDAAQSVHVTFEHADGASVGHVDLEIPARTERWRTWAQSSLIREPGKWTAIVRTPEGSELARSAFVVDAA